MKRPSTGSEQADLVFIVLWVYGLVLAHGFWSSVVCVVFPPWAFYLVIERLAIALGIA